MNKLQLNGLDNNGRQRFVLYSPVLKDIYGRDSTQLNRSNALESVGEGYWYKNRVAKINGEDKTIYRVIRLLPNEKNPEVADLIVAMDLSTIVNADGTPYVDLAPIKMKYVSFMALSINGTLEVGTCPAASSGENWAKAITMSLSPTRPLWAAAPFKQHTWLPRAPSIAYVSKRLPFSTSATSIFS